ncbi:MAG: HDOD domain-containing protein [Magnetococcales bacterium]|nr:HDOD domain-containing protein [Magnetococcales bacterium]
MSILPAGRVLFTHEDDLNKARSLLAGVKLPPQPKVVMDLSAEIRKPDPNFDKMVTLLSGDPALSAKLLRVVNSPLYGLTRRVDSLRHALSLLGMKNFFGIVLATALRDALLGSKENANSKPMEDFWTYSMVVARITKYLIVRNPMLGELVGADQAYLAGLFHDCAIPMFIGKHPDYAETVRTAKENRQNIFDAEEERYGAHHGAIGFMIARSWELPDPVCQAIRYHHYPYLEAGVVDETTALEILPLYEILRLGDFLGEHLLEAKGRDVAGCYRDQEEFLLHVNMTEQELEDLKEDVVDSISL